MAAMNFPASPTLNQIYSAGPGLPSYRWNGTVWVNVGTSASVMDKFTYTATGSEAGGGTIVPVPGGYLSEMIVVSRGGSTLTPGDDVITTSGTNLVFTVPLTAGETFYAIKFRAFSLMDVLTASQLGADIPNLPAWRSNVMRKVVADKSANYTVTMNDFGQVIAQFGIIPFTISLPPVATAGNGFTFTVRNFPQGGKITIDPNGSELVNGYTSIGVYGGDSVELVCDGVRWHAMFQSPFSIISYAQISTPVSFVDLKLPAEFSSFDLELKNFAPSSAQALGLRFSNDDGATFYTNSGGYAWRQHYASNSSDTFYHEGIGIFGSTGIELSAGVVGAQDGGMRDMEIRISPGKQSVGVPGARWVHGAATYTSYGAGFYGNALRMNAFRLTFSGATTIAAGSSYSLIGRRF